METTQSENRQTVTTAMDQVELRGQLVAVTTEKDDALATITTLQHKVSRLEDTVAQHKAKLTRVTQEKFQLQREHRVAMNHVSHVDTSASVDVEYYKRRVTELTGQLQAVHTQNLSHTRYIQDLEQQIQMSLSRQQAALWEKKKRERAQPPLPHTHNLTNRHHHHHNRK
jgi:prefoldin subunit 5